MTHQNNYIFLEELIKKRFRDHNLIVEELVHFGSFTWIIKIKGKHIKIWGTIDEVELIVKHTIKVLKDLELYNGYYQRKSED